MGRMFQVERTLIGARTTQAAFFFLINQQDWFVSSAMFKYNNTKHKGANRLTKAREAQSWVKKKEENSRIDVM